MTIETPIGTLARISTSAWLQSRAGLYLAKGKDPEEAARRAVEDFEREFPDSGIRLTHFDLRL